MSRGLLLTLILVGSVRADEATDALAKELREYAAAELAKVPGKGGKYSTALPDYLRKQIAAANELHSKEWREVKSRADWERFRDERIEHLRHSLGTSPDVPKTVPVRVTKTFEAKDYAIENLVYESRPGVWVTGNLYRPVAKRERMPVILIVHSHHAPKEQGELQDMGVTWAKLGCLVLVIDQLGHGERRQHPFHTAKDYPKEFRVGRQDYYVRYNLNLQLSLVGDSLMGWMAWDLMRGLDVVLARPGAEKDRVILLGAVAGGGDVAAVTAALDPRVKCLVPFNFGGPQPESPYPLPEDAETSFNYSGSGSWESTRNLRDSAARGFLPWVIVASVAPRKVIHAHEFAWDRDRDPVWKRCQKVWGFYDAADGLAFAHGTGVIRGNDPTASHCTNIGPIHRKGIYAALKKWFDIPVPETETNERRPASELRCWTPEAQRELKPRPLHEFLGQMADTQLDERRRVFEKVPAADRAEHLWKEAKAATRRPQFDHLGFAPPSDEPALTRCEATWVKRLKGPGANFVSLKLLPRTRPAGKLRPLVWCISQDGIHAFLEKRSVAVATLLNSNVTVVVSDVTGTGGDRPGSDRGRTGIAASLESTVQMLGYGLLGARLGDSDDAVGYARDSNGENPLRIAFWGESLVPPNPLGDSIQVPHGLSQPRLAEPMAATVVSLLPMDELNRNVKAVVARGGLVSYRSVLDSPFVHVPHDALPVNVFRAGDLPDVWAHLAPRPLRLEGLVDGTNRRVTGERLAKELRPVTDAYRKGGLVVKEDYTPDAELAKWIVEQLKR
jgi:hypothetical protein